MKEKEKSVKGHDCKSDDIRLEDTGRMSELIVVRTQSVLSQAPAAGCCFTFGEGTSCMLLSYLH